MFSCNHVVCSLFDAHHNNVSAMPPLSPYLCALLTPGVVARLKQQGIRTVADFISMDVALLSQRTAIPCKDLSSIRHALLSHFAPLPASAADLWEDLASTAALLPTGCNNLDELLDGGVMTGELTEVTGPPGSGKTQLCLSLAAAVAMETNSTVVVVDSRGSFSSLRLRDVILGRRGGEEEEAATSYLERVRLYHTFDLFELLTAVDALKQRVAEQEDGFHINLHLLIIDSVTPLLSPLLGGHQSQGHALMGHLALALRTLAQDHSVAVVYTNNTVSDGVAGSEGLKPALGRTWSHVPSTRVTLTCHPPHPPAALTLGRERRACLTKSSRQPTGISTAFSISGAGIQPWLATANC